MSNRRNKQKPRQVRRGRPTVAIVMLVLFAAVAAYIGYYIAEAFSSRISVAEAVSATAEDTIAVNLWFARDEYRVSLEGGADEIVVDEGEKVALGEVIAVSYVNGSAAGVHRELEEIEARLRQIRNTASVNPGEEISRADAEVSGDVYALSYAVASGNFGRTAAAADSLKTSVLRRDYANGRFSADLLASEISELEQKSNLLRGITQEASASLRASTSGYYSACADGYESVLSCDGILEMTPSDLDALANLHVQVERDNCGKIATNFAWRVAAVVTEEQAAQLSVNSWYTVRLGGDYVGEIRVRLINVSEPENGRCAIVFSGSKDIGGLLSLRRQNAEIILTLYEGLRVPKSAIRLGENGENGVYILLATQARFVPVEQIYEADNYYIVKYDPSRSRALRPGDEIIVRSKELFDGKVVE